MVVEQTEEFKRWLQSIKDVPTKARLLARLRKVTLGSLGDHKRLSEDVWELREYFGPGWRMYYTEKDGRIILMLGGGDKKSQSKDIAAAEQLAKELKDGQD
ncbi:addiction module killer protein [Comamonas serinivorans]|uniref:Addiction module killer protein n=1 Tax=Comamonas serinivorans TaxID=1082851 RepID=A0A1Y0EMB1_9BURK|nr:type II toxin-antitoxin system RelE/ParE family toxin [Comamonas serinivorans]ARU04726.1 addiction module killer protein [Comamonas serinivorans]